MNTNGLETFLTAFKNSYLLTIKANRSVINKWLGLFQKHQFCLRGILTFTNNNSRLRSLGTDKQRQGSRGKMSRI